MADVNPNSWRYTSILLLPGTRCYERFTDDTIDNTRKVIIDGIAGLGLTPRGKSRFQLVTDAFTNPGSFASKIASDKKSGLERKKQEVAEWKAEEAEKKKKAAEKEKKKARKRGKAKPVEKKKEIPEEDRELEEVKRDPAGVKAALSHMADDDGGGGGGGGGTSGSESDNDSNNSLKTLDLTEQEGAAGVGRERRGGQGARAARDAAQRAVHRGGHEGRRACRTGRPRLRRRDVDGDARQNQGRPAQVGAGRRRGGGA